MTGPPSPPVPRAVLVVDDDRQVRELLRQVLTSKGYAVLTASDGRAALDLLRRHGDVGLALVDVLMPSADGPAVLDALRQERPGLPACFLSSLACGYSEAELLGRGAAVLNKPLRPDEVLATLGRLMP